LQEPARLFQLGRYWIGRVQGSSRLYYFWYDAGTGEIRRRTLATAELERAKVKLAAIVLSEGDGRAREPKDVTLVAVLEKYKTEVTEHRPNPFAARRACDLLFSFLKDDAVRVAILTKDKQTEFMKWLRKEHGHSVAYISRVMSVIQAGLNRAVADDDDDTGAMLTRAPKIIVQPRTVAEILNAPEPTPRTWHPDIKGLARFLDLIPPTEETRLLRFTVLMLALGSRPEAIKQLAIAQIDWRYKLVQLNPDGRRQTKKHRPTLPIPRRLWKPLEAWSEDADTIVHKDKSPVIVLRKPWNATREAAGLPTQFTPYALRHMIATELRRRRVPKEQREMWMGHRRANVNDRYGIFDKDYLIDARKAVDAFLGDLTKACKKPIFRQVSAKPRAERPRLRLVS
jgi:integrase